MDKMIFWIVVASDQNDIHDSVIIWGDNEEAAFITAQGRDQMFDIDPEWTITTHGPFACGAPQ